MLQLVHTAELDVWLPGASVRDQYWEWQEGGGAGAASGWLVECGWRGIVIVGFRVRIVIGDGDVLREKLPKER